MSLRIVSSLILRLHLVVIILQSLYFKFNSPPKSVYLFTKLGVECWRWIRTVAIELVTSILELVPSIGFIGSFLGITLTSGAILYHLTIMGVETKGVGGQLLMLAIAIWVCNLIIIILNKHRGITFLNKLIKDGKNRL